MEWEFALFVHVNVMVVGFFSAFINRFKLVSCMGCVNLYFFYLYMYFRSNISTSFSCSPSGVARADHQFPSRWRSELGTGN